MKVFYSKNIVNTTYIYVMLMILFLLSIPSYPTQLPLSFHSIHHGSGKQLYFAFSDVLVECKCGLFITNVCRKPTFTCLYTNWYYFVPKSRKINLISTLISRALICSPCRLDLELENIHCDFCNTGYPANFIQVRLNALKKR